MRLYRSLRCLQPFSSLPNTTLGTGAAADLDPTCQLHLISRARHAEHGPLYVERFAPGVDLLFVSEPELCAKVLRSGGRHPKNVHPLCWTEYAARYGVERGLFFKDGPEWADWRRRMQPVLLKAPDRPKDDALVFSKVVTQKLVRGWETAARLRRPFIWLHSPANGAMRALASASSRCAMKSSWPKAIR